MTIEDAIQFCEGRSQDEAPNGKTFAQIADDLRELRKKKTEEVMRMFVDIHEEQFARIHAEVDQQVRDARYWMEVLFERFAQCKESNRQMSRRIKLLMRSKAVQVIPRVCVFCKHYRVGSVSAMGPYGQEQKFVTVECDRRRSSPWVDESKLMKHLDPACNCFDPVGVFTPTPLQFSKTSPRPEGPGDAVTTTLSPADSPQENENPNQQGTNNGRKQHD